MFGAIGRWLKAFGYLVTGQIDAAREVLDQNPHVIRAKYDPRPPLAIEHLNATDVDRIREARKSLTRCVVHENA